MLLLIKLLMIPFIRDSIQCTATLATTGDIRRTSKEKLYQELCFFESLQSRRSFRKLSLFYKKIKNELPSYLFHLIPKPLNAYSILKSCFSLTLS